MCGLEKLGFVDQNWLEHNLSALLLRTLVVGVVQRLRGWGCNKYVPVLGGDGTKIAPPRDLFDQPLVK